MTRVAFADESGLERKSHCYAIGVLSLDASRLDGFEKTFHDWKQEHGVRGEMKWKRLSNSHGAVNLAIAWLQGLLRSETAAFDVIVVNAAQFRNWQTGTWESAFYQTYTYLLKHVGRHAPVTRVFIDDRSDSYERHAEVVEIVANHMLVKAASEHRLSKVTKCSSAETYGIQVADVLTGAIAAACRKFLDPRIKLNKAKQLAIQRLADVLGWDDLAYDTYPNNKFNIWHFPEEYRAVPSTKRVTPRTPRFVTAKDLSREAG